MQRETLKKGRTIAVFLALFIGIILLAILGEATITGQTSMIFTSALRDSSLSSLGLLVLAISVILITIAISLPRKN